MDRDRYIAAGRQSTNIRDLRRFTGEAWGDLRSTDLDVLNAIQSSPSYAARLAQERPAMAPGAKWDDTPEQRDAAVAAAVAAAQEAQAPVPFMSTAAAQPNPSAQPDFSKIKRNVKRMIDGGAAETEIDTYLGSEGVTPEQLRASNGYPLVEPPKPDTAWSGGILPFSGDKPGDWRFDSDAGIFGALKRTFTLPGEVYRGEVPTQTPDAGTSQELIERGAEAGAVMSPVPAPVRSGSRAIEGVAQALRKQEPKTPTAQELQAAGGQQIQMATSAGVDYSPESVAQAMTALRRELEAKGFRERFAPDSFSIIDDLTRVPQVGPGERVVASLASLHEARQALNKAAQNFSNPREQAVASRAIEELDRFIADASPADVMAGPAAPMGATFQEGIANYAAGKRSQRLRGIEESDTDFSGIERAADLRAAAANSGKNLDNNIRQRVASLLLSPTGRSGYSAEELQALERISLGTVARNRIRDVGNYMGGGGGLGGVVAGGVAGMAAGTAGGSPSLGTLVGVGIPAAGVGVKSIANLLTRRALGEADTMVRKRSPLYESRLSEAPLVPKSASAKEAVLKALILQQLQSQQSGGGF